MIAAEAPDSVGICADIASEGPPLVLLAGRADPHDWWNSAR
jgi:hypothetical protein